MNKWFPGLVATLLIAAAGALWHLSGETADTKRRVEHVEKRQEEDRREVKEGVRETRKDVADVKSDVQQIRILLESMKRAQR